jgi:hypothetical protein
LPFPIQIDYQAIAEYTKLRKSYFVGSEWDENDNWFAADFFEELMQFIGCCPSNWTPVKFLGQVLGNLLSVYTNISRLLYRM